MSKALALLAVLSVLHVSSAQATPPAPPLRAPQVTFNASPLQGYLASINEPDINPATMQVNVQTWATTNTGNSTFTLMLKSGTGDEIGVYSATDPLPNLDQVFPSAATAGWFATMHFSGGNLIVQLFNDSGGYEGATSYGGVNAGNFGFYLKNTGGTYYSQDVQNLSGPQVLTYLGQAFPGETYVCFERGLANPQSTYDAAVVAIESVLGTVPTVTTSWGALKSKYR